MRGWVESSCVWRLSLVLISPIWTGRKRSEADERPFRDSTGTGLGVDLPVPPSPNRPSKKRTGLPQQGKPKCGSGTSHDEHRQCLRRAPQTDQPAIATHRDRPRFGLNNIGRSEINRGLSPIMQEQRRCGGAAFVAPGYGQKGIGRRLRQRYSLSLRGNCGAQTSIARHAEE